MGTVYCPGKDNHPHIHTGNIKCCWGCDKCPKEHGFRLTKGDYCPECVEFFKKAGYVWSEYHQNYIPPKQQEQRRLFDNG